MISRLRRIVCPVCESGELHPRGPSLVRCDWCGCALSREILEALRQIITLPDTLGAHACECGHPEMRRLPDEVFWCPACSSEVLPLKTDAHGGMD